MKNWLLLLMLVIPILSWSQPTLTLNEAISIALENNFGIQVAELQQKAEAMQVYKSNVGMGPDIDLNAGFNASGNNVNQNFTDGRVINRWGRTLNPNVNISLGMTLYDGGRMQAAYERLGLQSQMSELQSRLIIQNTVEEVMETYYDITRFKETLDFLETIITYYEERLKITEERWNVGQGSKLDFLQSKTDLNVQLSELAIAKNNLENTKVILNGILNRDPSTDFIIESIDNIGSDYMLEELIAQAKTGNRDILLLQKSLQISQKQEEELEAATKPQILLNSAIGYNYNNTTAGFLLSNRSVSANVGVTARYNLYDGSHRKKQIEISRLNSQIIEKQQESLEAQIINDLTQAYNQYISDKGILQFEEENKEIAEENLSISIEKFRLGGSTILELNEAQRAYDTALNRLVNAQYNIKVSELELLRLSGLLVE